MLAAIPSAILLFALTGTPVNAYRLLLPLRNFATTQRDGRNVTSSTEFLLGNSSSSQPPPTLAPQQVLCKLRNDVKLVFSANSEKHGKLQKTWGTCAVVSSSGVLRNSGHGHAIDSADLVFRFNDAPTVGFERDVGLKDDLRFVNDLISNNAKNHQEGNWYTSGFKKGVTYVLFPHNMGMVTPRADSMARKYPGTEVYRAEKSVVSSIEHILREVYAASWFGDPLDSSWAPTSGAVAMIVAMSVCKEVRAYGMAMTPRAATAPYHYYEAGGAADNTTAHKTFDAEKDLWRRLALNAPAEIDAQDVAVIPGLSRAQC